MSIPKVTTVENRRTNPHIGLAATAGAAIGTGARYVVPTKDEMSQIFNKPAVDEFVSNASAVARGSKRSILKYGGIGAAIAAGVSLLVNAFSTKNKQLDVEYSKYEALMDTPADSAYAVMWYGE